MLKRILALTLGASLMVSSAFASVSVEPMDVEKDLMAVSAEGFKGEALSIIVTNPGFTLAQALSGESGAIQYFGSYVPESESFTLPLQITGAVGGEFNVYILSQDGEQTGSFVFYNSVFKKDCIDDINNAAEGEDITEAYENLINAYGLQSDEMYTALGAEKCAEAFGLLKNSLPGKKLPDDIGDVLDLIDKSFVLAAFNSGADELCFSDGKLLHTDMLGLTDSDELADYYGNISPDFTESFNEKLLSGGYESIEDIADRFRELVYINVLINYKERGYGHIHGYFEKYEDAYEDAGFDIPSKENESIYRQLLNLEDDTLEGLAKKFNKLEDEDEEEPKKNTSSKGSGGGGGGGGSFTVGAGTSYVDPVPVQTPGTTEPEKTQSFTDVPETFWAYEPIEALSKKQWINGYENGEFRPEARITRAEYAKILLTAFGIEPGGTADFEDVDPSAWYAPYVAAAQANGIIKGDGTNYNPDAGITRQDAAVILCRLLGEESENSLDFDDANLVSDYAYPAISYLSSQGVINGYEDNTFKPLNTISRAEAAKIIHTLMEKGGING